MKKLSEMKLFMLLAMVASMLVVISPAQADDEPVPPPSEEMPQ